MKDFCAFGKHAKDALVTVQDLIDALSGFDPALRVVMPCEIGPADFCEVDGAFRDWVRFIEGGAELTDEREEKRTAIVRLFSPDL